VDHVQSYYDSNGLLTRVTDPHGVSRFCTYTGGVLSPDGGVTTLGYDAGWLLHTIAELGVSVLTLTHQGALLTQITTS
jgi:hypothetical protein